MTVVFEDASGTPGLHALVIGVGEYGSVSADQTMLQSAAPSAAAIAQWLYSEYSSPSAELRSLDVLLSPPGRAVGGMELRLTGNSVRLPIDETVEIAVMGLAKQSGATKPFGVAGAINGWYRRGNTSEENVMLLYLCGHGAEIVGDAHFFCDGFTTAGAAPTLGDAINLRVLEQAMTLCLARKQLLLFDCCRDVPSWATGFVQPGSSPIVENIDALLPNTRPLSATVIWAAAKRKRAGADKPHVSRFAEALLQVLKGPACDRRLGGNCPVSTSRIKDAIEDLILAGVLDWRSQDPSLGTGDRFAFHVPNAPQVPVVVHAPAIGTGESVEISGAPCTKLSNGAWHAWQRMGPQTASVVANGGVVRSVQVSAEPTYGVGEL